MQMTTPPGASPTVLSEAVLELELPLMDALGASAALNVIAERMGAGMAGSAIGYLAKQLDGHLDEVRRRWMAIHHEVTRQ